MIPLHKILWHESTTRGRPARQNEPSGTMDDPEQVRSYVEAYRWGGAASVLQYHHLDQLTRMIRPGDVVVDLACGPGPLLLELAALYPECSFIGADLSRSMLRHLEEAASERELGNVRVLLEDIRTLPSLPDASADLVITTSALHHVPDEASLRQVFGRMRTLLKPAGGFYACDFGLLKSPATRRLFVAEVAKLAPTLTVLDYELSLQAAFPIDVVLAAAADELPRPYMAARSALVDFLYFLQTPVRTAPGPRANAYLRTIGRRLSPAMRCERWMLRALRRRRRIA